MAEDNGKERDEIGAQGGASLMMTIRSAHAMARYEPPRQAFRRTPREDAAPSGPPVDATVKWFNEEKGFGFVELGDGSGDAFLHIGVLQSAGHDVVAPETKLRVQVGQGQKGRQVTAVLEVDASGVGGGEQSSRRSQVASKRERVDPNTASAVEGTVQWFSADKGLRLRRRRGR